MKKNGDKTGLWGDRKPGVQMTQEEAKRSIGFSGAVPDIVKMWHELETACKQVISGSANGKGRLHDHRCQGPFMICASGSNLPTPENEKKMTLARCAR